MLSERDLALFERMGHAPPTDELESLVWSRMLDAAREAGYRAGWNDRESDLIAGVDRIYPDAARSEAKPSGDMGGLRDIFERPFDGEDDPRIRVAQCITRAEAEAVLEHRGDMIAALATPTTKEGEG
ncbi:hypothetical protein [Phenylobacterium sp.]|uniref:hypothetical protein n=1 Tax=Phenylobacterium sp. TaxID=1871053 RepID=UPI0039610BAF